MWTNTNTNTNTRTRSTLFYLIFLQLYCRVIEVNSFSPVVLSGSFQLPKFEFPWFSNNGNTNTATTTADNNALNIGDKIIVFGGTGGVGQLVTKKLNTKKFKVRVAARDTQRADETLEDDTIETVQLDLTLPSPSSSTNEDMTNNSKQQDLEDALDGTSAVVISLGTTAFPTQKWKNGNTPSAIDRDAVSMIAKAASNVETIKKVVLVTSVGVNRIKEMPFLFLNLFGVLDCKRDGEDAVIAASKEGGEGGGFDFVVIRPGRLVGGPYTNLDVAKLLQIEGGTENGVSIARGDDLLGDCKRDALAEAVVQCLLNDECKDIDFSIISNEEAALTTEEWTNTFIELKGDPIEV